MDPEVIKELGKLVNDALKTNLSALHIGLYLIGGWIVLKTIFDILYSLHEKRQNFKDQVSLLRKPIEDSSIKTLYNEMNSIRTDLADHSLQEELLNQRIKTLRASIRDEELSLSDSLTKCFNEMLDLLSIAAIDRSSRKFELEKQLITQIKKDFRRI